MLRDEGRRALTRHSGTFLSKSSGLGNLYMDEGIYDLNKGDVNGYSGIKNPARRCPCRLRGNYCRLRKVPSEFHKSK